MKEYSDGNTDIRRITLKRKNVGRHCGESFKDRMPDGSGQEFFATDYFDVMSVERKSIADDFTDIMGVCAEDDVVIDEVSVQSFVLYGNSISSLTENPFDVSDEDKKKSPFLSIIQIHITPEILGNLEVTGMEAISLFRRDLETAVSDYYSQCRDTEPFTYGIYQLLSAGDFAVVVRSRQAKTAFSVSTLIRRRSVCAKESGLNLVLYKTYTILTIDGCIIDVFPDAEAAKGQFVLRGCYSNLYWSKKDEIKATIREMDWDISEIYGLNGRYDFSVQLNVNEFRELFPDLKQYKFPKTDKRVSRPEKKCADKIEYLCWLMQNDYVSYVNERYLLDAEEVRENDKESISDIVVVRGKEEKFLDEKIREKVSRVYRRYQQVSAQVEEIKAYRKNLNYYMKLLGKMIRLCQAINISSDTRIYAVVLLEQLEYVIDSIDIYQKLYFEEKKSDILDIMDDCLRVSVYTLDCYAGYIRNNNLQTVQTPNYNIESKVSMEKILIGYGEFLKQFMDFYLSCGLQMDERRAIDDMYLPVVVPGLHEKEVSVEVMFQEGNGDKWETEEDLRESAGQQGREYLLVITIPTLYELNRTRNLSVSLFHEVAHQFRYESRKNRNDTLLKYILERVCGKIAGAVLEEYDKKAEYTRCEGLYEKLKSSLEEKIRLEFFSRDGELSYPFQKNPLNSFRAELQAQIYIVLKENNIREQIEMAFRRFVLKVNEYVDGRESGKEALLILNELKEEWMKKRLQEEDEEELGELERKIVNAAFATVHYYSASGVEEEADRDTVNKFIEEVHHWDRKEEYDGIDRELREAFYQLADWIYRFVDDDRCIGTNAGKNNALYKSYEELCNIWRERMAQFGTGNDHDQYLSWNEYGRYLGIDWEQDKNRDSFIKIVQNSMEKLASDIDEDIENEILYYREETADIFMNVVLGLSAFGYLTLLAENLPHNEDIPEEYEERVIYVICVLYCEESGNIEERKLQDVFVETMQKVCSDIEEIIRESSENQKVFKYLLLLMSKDGVFDPTVENGETLRNLDSMILYMGEWANTDKSCREIVKKYLTVIRILRTIYLKGPDYIKQLNGFRCLEEDFIKGKEQIGRFRRKMSAKDSSPQIRKIDQYCIALRDMLEDPYHNENKEKISRFNEISIEFFLSMYYLNKINRAGELKGEEYEN